MATIRRCGAAMVLAGLAGCVAQPAQPPPLVVIPGPTKTASNFQADDVACRAAAADAPPVAIAAVPPPASPAAPSQVAPSQAAPVPPVTPSPAAIYLRCMSGRDNIVQPLAPVRSVAYGYGLYGPPYAPLYGPYDGYYTYPWLYDGYVSFGLYGGYGGFRGGGWHGGGWGGGFHGGGGGPGGGHGR